MLGRKSVVLSALCLFVIQSVGFALAEPGTESDSKTARARLNGPSTTVVDMVIASVGGEPITSSDLRQYTASLGLKTPLDIESGSNETKTYLRELILTRIFEKEAEKIGFSVGEEEIAAYLKEIKQQNGVDDAGFAALLKEKDLTLDGYKHQIKMDILKTRILSAKVRSQVNIVDEDIARYLDEHPDLKAKEGQVHLRQIKFPLNNLQSEEEREASRKMLSELRERLVEKESWEQLGGSNYTDMGFVSPEDLRPEFSEALSNLKQEEVSDIIETSNGLYLLIYSPAEGGQLVDKATRDEIRNELFQKKFQEMAQTYLKDELPKQYNVEIKL